MKTFVPAIPYIAPTEKIKHPIWLVWSNNSYLLFKLGSVLILNLLKNVYLNIFFSHRIYRNSLNMPWALETTDTIYTLQLQSSTVALDGYAQATLAFKFLKFIKDILTLGALFILFLLSIIDFFPFLQARRFLILRSQLKHHFSRKSFFYHLSLVSSYIILVVYLFLFTSFYSFYLFIYCWLLAYLFLPLSLPMHVW